MLVRLGSREQENGKLGNKGKFLLLMKQKQNGFNVPDGFVLDSDTYDETVKGEPEKAITNTLEGLNKDNLKETRADLKRTAEKLEKAHPDSESIKYGFTIALMGA